MEYRRDVDGLRGIAVIPVILFHAGVPATSGGFVGVDVFFVISGYLISQTLVRDIVLGRFSIIEFYVRRIRRVLPALFFTMIFTSVLSYIILAPSYFSDFCYSLVTNSMFISNLYFWRNFGYF